jgi:hypothetical protein
MVRDTQASTGERNPRLRRLMEKKTYETPQLQCLGSVRELTALTDPCSGSIETDFPSDLCQVEGP